MTFDLVKVVITTKKYFIVALICLLTFFCSIKSLASDEEAILSFDSEVTVFEDASMQVTETIKVRSTGDQIKRGIYRDFPTRYKDNHGNRYIVGFDVVSVKRDGIAEHYFVRNLSNGKRVYIGSEAVYLPPGVYTYTIVYKTNRQLGFFKEHDELYWNVTGNGWSFPINQATATINLPKTIPLDKLSFTGYTGKFGSVEQNCVLELDASYRPVFKTTKRLEVNEGLTIVVTWPKGYIQKLGVFKQLSYFIRDNFGITLMIGGFFILLLFYLIVWSKVGRDPQKGTIIPLYRPPLDLSPAAMRFILNMGYDNKVFAAAIINMAVKGVLTIEQGFDTVIIKRSSDISRLSNEEKQIFSNLLENNAKFTFNDTYYQKVAAAINTVNQTLTAAYENKYFVTNTAYFVGGLFFSSVVTIPVFMEMVKNERFNFVCLIFIIFHIVTQIIFFRLLKAPTIEGRKVLDQVEGFKMYLSIAEKERLNLLNPPNETPELFERYLPYALALGVEQLWAERFAKVFDRLKEQGQPYIPVWYHGADFSSGNIGMFANSLGNSLTSSISSSSVAPGSSSGSSGGGSSGGGGGGGGGGGW